MIHLLISLAPWRFQAFSEAVHRLAARYPGHERKTADFSLAIQFDWVCVGGPKEDAIFSYFDTFGGVQMPALSSNNECILQLIDRGMNISAKIRWNIVESCWFYENLVGQDADFWKMK